MSERKHACGGPAGHYTRLRLRWQLAAASAELLLLIGLSLLARRLVPYLIHVEGPAASAAGGLLVLASMFAYWLALVPIVYHGRWRLRERFALAGGTARQAWARASADVAARAALAVLFVAAVSLVRAATGRYWPAWVAWLLLACELLGRLWARRPGSPSRPTVGPPQRASVLQDLRDFAAGRGFGEVEVRMIPRAEVGNELVAGYEGFPSRPTVYLSETLVERFTPRELLAAFAHELAHHRRHLPAWIDWLAGPAVRTLAVTACVWVFLPALAPDKLDVWQAIQAGPAVLMVVWLCSSFLRPVLLLASRRAERRANEAALAMTRDPQAFISAMRKLAAGNLVAGRPGWWQKLFSATHPSLDETLACARRFAATNGK